MKIIDFNGDHLSKLSLGTAQFGLNYGIANNIGQPDIYDVKEIMDYVLENGINCFDTASAYGNSEEVLGKSINKEKISYIISKLSSNDFIRDLEGSVDRSLRRLQCQTLYGLLLHDSKLLLDWDNSFDNTVAELLASNKVKYFGVSIYTENDFSKALENKAITIIQIPFNIFDQRAIKYDWFRRAKAKNKLLFIRSVYLQGLLLMDKNSLPANLQGAKRYLDILKHHCELLDTSAATLALSFVNSVAKESLILFGCDNLLQAQQNINIFNGLSDLSDTMISNIYKDFKDVPENIFNPTKWQHE